MNHEKVVIVGASNKPARYSHRALLLLRRHGHAVVPVHPKLTEIEGIPVISDVSAISGPVDTVTRLRLLFYVMVLLHRCFLNF